MGEVIGSLLEKLQSLVDFASLEEISLVMRHQLAASTQGVESSLKPTQFHICRPNREIALQLLVVEFHSLFCLACCLH